MNENENLNEQTPSQQNTSQISDRKLKELRDYLDQIKDPKKVKRITDLIKSIPAELQQLKSFTLMHRERATEAEKHDSKKPIDLFYSNPENDETVLLSFVKHPDHLVDFVNALYALAQVEVKNPHPEDFFLGFFVQKPYIFLDVDDIPDLIQNHTLGKDDLISKLDKLTNFSYSEISQSHAGLHYIFKGKKTRDTSREKGTPFEMYDCNRYVTLTGNKRNTTLGIYEVNTEQMMTLEQELWGDPKPSKVININQAQQTNNSKFDDRTIDTIIHRAEIAKNGAYFTELFNGSSPSGDTSSDDLAFCNLLAFWTKKNPKLMDAIFRKSKRMRSKWDEIHSADGRTYAEMTIDASLDFVTEVYNEAHNTLPTNANVANKFKSMSDLFTALSDLSLNWRKAHADKKGNPADYGDMSDRVILSLLASIEPFRILVSDPTNPNETVKAPIYFYDWDTGLWSNDGDRIESMILAVNPTITSRRKRQDLVDTLKKSPEFDVKITKLSVVTDSEHRYIPVGNGIFDEEKQELLSFDPNRFFFVSKISTPFDPNATVEPVYNGWSVSRMILNIATDPVTKKVDDEKVKLLWEILKAGATGASWLRVSVLLKDSGQGSTGKSTFTDLLTNLIGQQNVANLRLVDLQDPTKLIEATHVNLIIGDDNDPEIPLSKFDNFNTVVSSDPLRVRSYYKESYSTRLHVFMIQSANGLPPLTKAKAAVYNRLVVVDFNTQFDSSKDANWHVKHDYIKREDLLKWLLNYLLTKVKLGHSLTQTKESQKELKEIRTESDSVYTFSNEVLDLIPVSAVPSTYMYALYFDWSRANGVPRRLILSQPKFTRELRKQEAFIKSWDYVPKNCQIKDPWSFTSPNVMTNTTDPFANKNQENAYTLLKDYAYQVNEYQTMDFSLPQGKKYRGSGFERKPQKSDTKVESNK